MTYTRAHLRVSDERGPARDRDCDGCGGPAAQWAYDHSDPDERFDEARSAPYSDDPARYLPLCVPCHVAYDRSGRGWGRCARPGCGRWTQPPYDYCHRHPMRQPAPRSGISLGHSFGSADKAGRKRPVRTAVAAVVTEKLCPACDQVKPAASFSSDRSKASGLASRCLPCDRAHSAARYRKRRAASY